MHKRIEKIVIVGGGTAGWLSAIHLSRFWKRGRGTHDVEITVVESPTIPTIGVGEATTGLFTTFIRDFSNEREFLRETKATFKLGILYRDWRRKGEFYLEPLNDDRQLGIPSLPPQTYPYFYAASIAEQKPVWSNILNSQLMLDGLSPYSRPPGEKELSAWDYGYHFDNRDVGAFLRARTQGVTQVEGTVTEVKLDTENGHVRSVLLEDGREITGDFFIDCSGFRKLIIGETYGEEWISYSDHLPINRALPFSVPRETSDPLPSYTHSWALSAGWLWEIPTQERTGSGYVYCDDFITPDEAHAEVETALGYPVEPWGDIRIDAGRFRRLWIKNCVAIGLAAGFAEPLESTSIHGQLVQLLTLVQEYLSDEFDFDATPILDRYNLRMARMYDDFRDLLVIHYQGGRNDSDFWRSRTINDSAQERLNLWRVKTPLTTDLESYFGAIDMKLWLYTLDGLGLLDPEVARREIDYYGLWDEANRAHTEQRRKRELFVRHAIPHAKYLESLASPAENLPSSQETLSTRTRQQKLSRAERRRQSRGRR